MKHFRVRYKTCTMNLGGFDPEYSWSRDSTSQHHEILGIEEVPEGGYSDLVAGLLIGVVSTQDRLERQAVEMEKAHWCIEDHKKVFSWEECE